MEWSVNNTFKTYKDVEPKSMMEMVLSSSIDPIEIGLGSSEKGNAVPTPKVRKKTMTSIFLKFFETALDGKTRRCKFCGQSYSIATATGNLGRHLSNRHPGYDKTGDIISSSAPKPSTIVKKPLAQGKLHVDYDHLNWLLIKWLILASLPPSTVEEKWLANCFKFLNPSIQLWPGEKYIAVVNEVFRSMQEDVKISLEQVSSKVSVKLNFWTSYEDVFYMSVTGNWIDDNWSFHRVLLDICRIPYPCGGSEIHRSLVKVFKTYNVENRILSCTHDNSQNAIHACHTFKENLDSQKLGPFFYMPCAARTLSLIIDDALRTMKPVIAKVREFVQELNVSKEISDDFVQLTAAYQEGSWKLPLDSSTRWSGNYQMLNIVCKACKSMDAVIRKYEETLGTKILLSAAEKNAVSIMRTYLDLDSFHKTTSDMCTNRDLTVGLGLLFMDNISETIVMSQKSCHNPDWLRTAAEDMAKKARSYNNQVCDIYTYITAILDPRIKTEYIPESINLKNYLEEARTVFLRNYSSSHFSSMASGYRSQEIEDGGNVSFAEEIARRKRRATINNTTDELTQYLSESIVPMQTEVVEWWKANSSRYPRLSVMACDFLSVQATSVPPEELFCTKGDEIDKQRFCMPRDSTQAILCIKSWTQGGIKLKFKSTEIDYESLMELASAAAVDTIPLNLDKKQK